MRCSRRPFYLRLRQAHARSERAKKSARAPVSLVSLSSPAGALLATAFYLILFESTHLIPKKGLNADGCNVVVETEGGTAAWWGSMVLIGFITSFVLDLFASLVMPSPPVAMGLELAPPRALTRLPLTRLSSTLTTAGGARDEEPGDRRH